MSDADSDTILSAMGFNRQKIIIMCWEMIADAEKSGLPGDESLGKILDKVAFKMSLCLW